MAKKSEKRDWRPSNQNYINKMKELGFVRVMAWVPPSAKPEVLKLAERRRQTYLKDKARGAA